MKKIILIVLCAILVGCSSSDNLTWPEQNIVEYRFGNITSIEDVDNGKEIKITSTTKEELLQYIEALKTITFEDYDAYDNSELYTLSDGNKYIELDYEGSENNSYDLKISIYDKKPDNWK